MTYQTRYHPNIALYLAPRSPHMWDDTSKRVYCACATGTAILQQPWRWLKSIYLQFGTLRRRCGPSQLRLIAVRTRYCSCLLGSFHRVPRLSQNQALYILSQRSTAIHSYPEPDPDPYPDPDPRQAHSGPHPSTAVSFLSILCTRRSYGRSEKWPSITVWPPPNNRQTAFHTGVFFIKSSVSACLIWA